jgi:hypothetical protein
MIFNTISPTKELGLKSSSTKEEHKSRIFKLISRFEGIIDDDVALRFIGTFQRELSNLIIYKK